MINKEQAYNLYEALRSKEDVLHTLYKVKDDFHVCSCGEPVRYCSSDKLVGHWNPNLINPSDTELSWMVNRVDRIMGSSSGVRFSNEEKHVNKYTCSLVRKSLRYRTWTAVKSATAESFPLALRNVLLKYFEIVKEGG